MFETCRHIMPSGLRCQAAAMRGHAFCYFHGRRILPSRKPAPRPEDRIRIPTVLDNRGINDALGHIVRSLAKGRISPRRASVLIYGLQMAANPPACIPQPADPDLAALLNPSLSDEEMVSLANSLLVKMGVEPPPSPGT